MANSELDDHLGDADRGSMFFEINITPLTDVFLVMVIIFMVSALAVQVECEHERPAVERRAALELTLPPGGTRDLDATRSALVLEVLPSGEVAVGGKRIRDASVDDLFRVAIARDRNTHMVLKADRAVPHGRVVNLMERARRAGVASIAIGTSAGAE